MLESIPIEMLYALLALSLLFVVGSIYRIIRIRRSPKIKPTHMLKITFTEPIKELMYYKNNLNGLKLGLKIRGYDFKHALEEGLDVVRVRGSFESMDALLKGRALEKLNIVEEKTGSIKTEELTEIVRTGR